MLQDTMQIYLDKIDNFLRKYDFPKLISEETENLRTDLHKRNGEICQ